MLSVQILIAKSPLATFTTFVYTIEKEGLVLQGKILGLSHFFSLIMLSAAHCGVIITAVLLIEAPLGRNQRPR